MSDPDQPKTVNRRGRHLIVASVPGGIAPPPNAQVSPATVVNGKPSGSLIGFRVSERSRNVIAAMVDEEGVTLRTWMVQVLNHYLATKSKPPLPDPLYEHRRAKPLRRTPELDLVPTGEGASVAETDHDEGIDLTQLSQDSAGGALGGSSPEDDDVDRDEARAAASQLLATQAQAQAAQAGDLERWMKEHAPRSSLNAVAREIETLAHAGYGWQQVASFLRTVKGVEVTPEALWEWWQQRQTRAR